MTAPFNKPPPARRRRNRGHHNNTQAIPTTEISSEPNGPNPEPSPPAQVQQAEGESSQPSSLPLASSSSSKRRRRNNRSGRAPEEAETSGASSELESRRETQPGRLNVAAPSFVPGGLNVAARDFVPGGGSYDGPVVAESSRASRGYRQHKASKAPKTPKDNNPPKALKAPKAKKEKGPKPPLKPIVPKNPSTAGTRRERIHEDIANNVLSCTICLDNITARTPIWSGCTHCGGVTHFKCTKEWANTSQADTFPCPCCSSPIDKPFPAYAKCWCGAEEKPAHVPGLPAHSCGQTCRKERETCPHPCSEVCHAALCPSCDIKRFNVKCVCGKESQDFPCGVERKVTWQCDTPCGKLLDCQQHNCEKTCHKDSCGSCTTPITALCYCGKHQGQVSCEQNIDVQVNVNYGQVPTHGKVGISLKMGEEFLGVWDCKEVCGKYFNCGIHQCKAVCHTGDCSRDDECPLSPNIIKTCPCGKKNLSQMRSQKPRSNCQDPIPTCLNMCSKLLPCGHFCKQTCHEGDCGQCNVPVEITCRCRRETKRVICWQGIGDRADEPFVCERPCRDELSCTKHICKVICCPSRVPPALRPKKKNRRIFRAQVPAAHQCVKICTNMKRCGNHECGQVCHSGECPTCLEADMDDQTCPCGMTLWKAPVPCGARIACRWHCHRRPTCGHELFPKHPCHYDDTECPPCSVRIEKPCMCGKRMLSNMLCGGKVVSCGLICGKALSCGHFCQKLCHQDGDCQTDCSQLCLQPRPSCNHRCNKPCHGSTTPCPETLPCPAIITLTCPCSRHIKDLKCLVSSTNQNPPSTQPLACVPACTRLDRAKAFAAALGIQESCASDDTVPFSDAALNFFRDNSIWAAAQEEVFRKFVSSSNVRLPFKPLSTARRAFLHALAEAFELKSLSQDAEPKRSVFVYKPKDYLPVLPPKSLRMAYQTRARLRQAAKDAQDVAEASTPVATEPSVVPMNTLVIKKIPGFITIEDVATILAPAFSLAGDLKHSGFCNATEGTIFFRLAVSGGMDPVAFTHLLRRVILEAGKAFDYVGSTEETGLGDCIIGLAETTADFQVLKWDPDFPESSWGVVKTRREKGKMPGGIDEGMSWDEIVSAGQQQQQDEGGADGFERPKMRKKRFVVMGRQTREGRERERRRNGFGVLEGMGSVNGNGSGSEVERVVEKVGDNIGGHDALSGDEGSDYIVKDIEAVGVVDTTKEAVEVDPVEFVQESTEMIMAKVETTSQETTGIQGADAQAEETR